MSRSAAIAELTPLPEQIDELSTRLLVEGSLSAADLQQLADSAADQGHAVLAGAARTLEGSLRSGTPLEPEELNRRLSQGLEDLRMLIDTPTLDTGAGETKAPDRDSLSGDEDLIREFVMESGEHLVNIEAQMLLLEKNTGDSEAAETLNAVFRAFHTIKGLAGFLEFAAIQSLAHEVETLLDLARNGELAVTASLVDVVLESTDIVRKELTAIEARLAGNPAPAPIVDDSLLQRIRRAAQGNASGTTLSVPPASPASLEASAVAQISKVQEGQVIDAPRTRSTDGGSVRIDTGKLDQLMDMVGEMVIAQTLIGHSPALANVTDPRLLSDLTQLARITADVQRITTGMRMVPIGTQFQKTARVIRDLSRRAGKQIAFETSGEETEVDKTIAEEISDPLLHMVRNSIDHGIEPPEERIALGKDPTAHIRLKAYHESGQIVIAISDDGRGLSRERILAKAIERGLVQPGAQLTESEIFLLIFEAGFSTAEKLTDISGRGVGMDVVRRHVQALRGSIEIQSKAGQGTTFLLKLPLTLAIIEGLVVVVGDQRYIAPIFSVKEMFRPTASMISTVQGASEMVMVRGGLLPIVRLHQRFHKVPRTTVLTEGTLIVAEAQGRQFCLFVDDLVGKQEVVIKSLGPSFSHVVGIAGCAILGDGKVGLILDLHGIFKGKI
jgi:two-component system chemotaxis sensor kinase CheA